MKATIGRIVHYNTTEQQREAMSTMGCNMQEKLPATIVAVFDNHVNLKVHVDGGIPDLWLLSIPEKGSEYDHNPIGSGGNWEWPERV